MVLHDLLAHCRGVRVGHGDHVNHVIVAALGRGRAYIGLVTVILGGVIPNNIPQELELLLHGVVDPGLNGAHHFQHPLKNRQCGAHRCLRTHIRHLHISGSRKALGIRHDLVHQQHEGLARLFVGEGQEIVPNRTSGYVNIAEFTRSNRCVVALDPHPSRLETPRQIRQRARIDQLTQQ